MWIVALGSAFAQEEIVSPDYDAQLYRTPVDAEQSMWVDDSSAAPDGYVAAKLVTGYMTSPLVFVYDDGERVALVKDALSINAIAAASFKRIRLGLDIPMYAVATSDLTSGGGLGDIALDLKGTVLPRAEFPVGLALAARLKFPTGSLSVPLTAPNTGWEVEAIVDRKFGPLLVALNVGQRGSPKTSLGNVELNDQLFLRLGAGYAISESAGASLDLNSSFNWGSFGAVASTPVEAMAGGYGRVGTTPIVLRGGLGTGLSRGIGAPSFRGVLSVGFEPIKDRDSDKDGLLDRKDQCPTEAEDVDSFRDDDGCPDPDNDADGIVDLSDTCRDAAEDKDEYKDTDGCPDPNTEVHIRFLDPEKKPVPGAQAVLGGYFDGREVRETGDDDFIVELPPGSYTWTAKADQFLPGRGSITVIGGKPQAFDLTIEPDLPPGELQIRVLAPNKKPISAATLSIDTGSPEPTDAGEMFVVLPAKTFVVTARAEGFAPKTQSVDIIPGGHVDVVLELMPSKVKVTKEKLDIKDKVFFELGIATIKAESFPLLDEISRILLDRPDIVKMRIEGHTDSQGDDASNLRLSQDRAASVRQYFIDKGVTGDRLSAIGFGETKPIDMGKGARAHERNRRVEFFIESWANE
jgi:OOP family OmpA-OmpF porin